MPFIKTLGAIRRCLEREPPIRGRLLRYSARPVLWWGVRGRAACNCTGSKLSTLATPRVPRAASLLRSRFRCLGRSCGYRYRKVAPKRRHPLKPQTQGNPAGSEGLLVVIRSVLLACRRAHRGSFEGARLHRCLRFVYGHWLRLWCFVLEVSEVRLAAVSEGIAEHRCSHAPGPLHTGGCQLGGLYGLPVLSTRMRNIAPAVQFRMQKQSHEGSPPNCCS